MSENLIKNKREYPVDVNIIEKDGREFIIIGTAHISKQSANLVREVIEKEMPDVVCVELDSQRFKALSEQKKWESLDLKTLIREKQLTTLIVNILLSSYQKKLGEKLGVMPGIELLEAANTAKELGLPIELCDREIRITLRRAWNSLPFSQKFKLIFSGFAGIFDKQELTEEKLEEIRQKDVLSEMMNELGKSMPALKRVLIDERDVYITQKMKNSVGKKVVSVVGAGHVSGIVDALNRDEHADLEAIEKIPPGSKLTKIVGWGIPVIIIGSIVYIGYTKGLVAAGDNLLYWILANGIPSAFGALLALGHPLTVLTAFIAAPFTSLTPVIGAGYVAAFVQAYFQPPLVKEIQAATADVNQIKKWWSNKLLRIILVFILSGLGSALGTYIGAYEIISNLF